MATVYSTQRASRVAVPSRRVKTNEWHGRDRKAFFSYTVPTGNNVVGDVIELCEIPAGSRLFGGMAAWEAMSSAGGDSSVQIGVTGTVAKYLATTSVDAAGVALIGNTIALFYGEELTSDILLIATVTTEAWVAAKKFYGHMSYMLD
jgi:hypothetical protein